MNGGDLLGGPDDRAIATAITIECKGDLCKIPKCIKCIERIAIHEFMTTVNNHNIYVLNRFMRQLQ